MHSYYSIISSISTFSFLIPFILGLIYYRKLKAAERVILIILLIVFVTEIINSITASKGINNLIVGRIYSLFEFYLLLYFYTLFFQTNSFRKLSWILALIFPVLALLDYLKLNGESKSDSFAATSEGLIFISFSLAAFYRIMKYVLYDDILNAPFFWINTAYLTYFAGTLFMFAFFNMILKNQEQYLYQVYLINVAMNFICYILIAIGFWKTRKT